MLRASQHAAPGGIRRCDSSFAPTVCALPLPAPSTGKAELRTLLNARRNALPREAIVRMSASITRSLLALDAYRQAPSVLAYVTFGSEFITKPFIDAALEDGKRVALPKIDRANDRLALYTVCDLERELAAGPWGIREPRPDVCPAAALPDIAFILVPGLGFTVRGDRLGYGRGYYDRLLATRRPETALVAAAFSVQVVDELPMNEHDVPVDLLITELASHARASSPPPTPTP
jgi:5-formyltetrahydrofolate cyclo-ligase